MTLPLFEYLSSFDRQTLAQRLRTLAQKNIWIGTSSWKYPGWLDQIYTASATRRAEKFRKNASRPNVSPNTPRRFPSSAAIFRFTSFQRPEYWHKLFASAPLGLQFALKVPEEVTAEVFPKHARYGPRAGLRNESYLNADALAALFLEPLEPFRQRICALIFEFGARGTSPREFAVRLDPFLGALPQTFRYAVEVRNREYLQPRYFEILRQHRAAHVLNSWTKMPPLSEQMDLADAFPADFTVARALLRPGRAYEDAVRQFTPYDQVRDENPEARDALRALIRRMREERRAAYIFVNNRLEGNAPETIRAVTAE